MKISVDGKEIFQLEEWEKKAIKNDIHEDEFEKDMHRRLEWVLKHKAERCFHRLWEEWVEKLRNDPSVSSIPKDKAAFIDMITARPDYQDRKKREELIISV